MLVDFNPKIMLVFTIIFHKFEQLHRFVVLLSCKKNPDKRVRTLLCSHVICNHSTLIMLQWLRNHLQFIVRRHISKEKENYFFTCLTALTLFLMLFIFFINSDVKDLILIFQVVDRLDSSVFVVMDEFR